MSPPSRPPASDDRTPLYLLVLLCAGAAALLLRPIDPAERLPETSGLGHASRAGTPAPEVALDDLQTAIVRLERWVTASYEQAATPFERALGVQGLGRNKANLEHQALVACLRDWSPAVVAGDDRAAAAQPLSAATAAAILLEAGVAPTERLTTHDGELRLQELVQQALDTQPDTTSDDARLAWRVQLLALAVANGMTQYESELTLKSELALGRLEREYRSFDVRQAATTLDPARVRELAHARRLDADTDRDAERAALQLSAAVFLASGVSPRPALEGRVRRHLQSLLLRNDLERAVYDQLLKESRGPATEALRLRAFEQFGRLAQALFMAHVAWRQTPTDPFPPALAPVMRQTARDLLVLFDQLQKLGTFDPAHPTNRPALLNATVQALRGLRTARAAVTS